MLATHCRFCRLLSDGRVFFSTRALSSSTFHPERSFQRVRSVINMLVLIQDGVSNSERLHSTRCPMVNLAN